jgi:hypothetical protein
VKRLRVAALARRSRFVVPPYKGSQVPVRPSGGPRRGVDMSSLLRWVVGGGGGLVKSGRD